MGKEMRTSHKRCFKLACVVCALLVCGVILCLRSKFGLVAAHYSIASEKLSAPVRIVQLTDLHNSEFGKDNERLVAFTAQQHPDIIVLTGDMLNGKERETGIAAALIKRLAEVAPVYASYGNHERTNEEIFGSDLKALYEQSGAVMLEGTYQDVEINGQTIRLGGLLGYALPQKYGPEAKRWEYEYIQEFQNTALMTVLLCHYPTCWIKNDILDDWNVDVVFSGHTHGGQIRLPLIGGLYATDRGFFPGRECGLYVSQDQLRTLVLSRGLGSSGPIPRFNNVPEIVVVDLLPGSDE